MGKLLYTVTKTHQVKKNIFSPPFGSQETVKRNNKKYNKIYLLLY